MLLKRNNIVCELVTNSNMYTAYCKPHNINESNKVTIRYILYMDRSWRSDRWLVTGAQPPKLDYVIIYFF